jgi:hypothetical protein
VALRLRSGRRGSTLPRKRHVPHLRCSAFLYTTHPALTRWVKYVAPPALSKRNDEEPAGSRHYAKGTTCHAPTRAGVEAGACLRRDLSRRGGVRRVRRPSGAPGGRECAENPGPDDHPCACWRVRQAFELGGAPGWPQTGMVARPVHRDIKTGRSASLKTVRVTPPNIHSLT